MLQIQLAGYTQLEISLRWLQRWLAAYTLSSSLIEAFTIVVSAPLPFNISGVVLGLLHLAVGEDILLRILDNLTLVTDEVSCENLCLKKLIKLL